MIGNCGFADGVVHLHGEACYQAGLAEGRATGEAPVEIHDFPRVTTEVVAALRRENDEAGRRGWKAAIGVDDVALLLDFVDAALSDREANAYRVARRRLRHLHTSLAGQRQDWANNTEQPCSSARAVAYQSAMNSVHSIIDEIEAIAGGLR